LVEKLDPSEAQAGAALLWAKELMAFRGLHAFEQDRGRGRRNVSGEIGDARVRLAERLVAESVRASDWNFGADQPDGTESAACFTITDEVFLKPPETLAQPARVWSAVLRKSAMPSIPGISTWNTRHELRHYTRCEYVESIWSFDEVLRW